MIANVSEEHTACILRAEMNLGWQGDQWERVNRRGLESAKLWKTLKR
jgi:hypothetical protein